MRFLLVIAGLLFNLNFIAQAQAEVVKADGASFDLQLPTGYCAMSRKQPVEKQHYELQDRMQQEVNAVLLMAVPCSDIDLVRAGKPWKQWMIWLLNGKPGNHTKLPATMTRGAVVEELAKAMPAIDLSKVTEQVDKAAGKEGIGLKIRNMSVLAKDNDALYTTQTLDVSAAGGTRQIGVVMGWVALKEHILTVNAYADYKGIETIKTLQTLAKDALMRTITATEKQK